jgi:hypothetical protein
MTSDVEVLEFAGTQIETKFAGEDLWRLAKRVDCAVKTRDGVLKFTMRPGFPTNMRSGSHAIDFIIPKFNDNNLYNLAILVHDFNYTKNRHGENYLSRLFSDQLLREMIRISGTLNALKRALMYRTLRLFGNSAYESKNTGEYAGAENFMEFGWSHK